MAARILLSHALRRALRRLRSRAEEARRLRRGAKVFVARIRRQREVAAVAALRAHASAQRQLRRAALLVGGALQPELQLIKQGLTPPLPALSAELPAPLQEALQDLTADLVFLETSFLDGDFRVARGPGKEVWVLGKSVQ